MNDTNLPRPEIVIPPPPNQSLPEPETAKPINYRKLPARFIDCPKDDLIVIISRMLAFLIKINDTQSNVDASYLTHQNLTRFHSRSPPQISLFSYMSRLSQYSSLENSVLITSIYYIDLLTLCYPIFAVNSLTVHRFLLTATTVASKALCDSFCSNSHYAKVGGVNLMELNLLETEFLNKVGYRVVPRDFNYDALKERKSSTGTLDVDYFRQVRLGVGAAADVLELYYNRMVMLVGGKGGGDAAGSTTDSAAVPSTDENRVFVGCNDDVVYYIDTTGAPDSAGQSTAPIPLARYQTDGDSLDSSDSSSEDEDEEEEDVGNVTGNNTGNAVGNDFGTCAHGISGLPANTKKRTAELQDEEFPQSPNAPKKMR